MKLTCPSCGTSFFIGDAILGDKGRKVRCSKCKHIWYQVPTQEGAADGAESAQAAAVGAEKTAPKPAAAGSGEATSGVAAPSLPRQSKLDEPPRRLLRHPPEPPAAGSRSRGVALGWLILLLAVVSTLAALWFARHQIVAMAPEMGRIYALVGLPVEEPIDDALHLRDVTSVRREVDGKRLVVIEGYVINLSGQSQEVPLLRAELKGPPGVGDREWTFEAEQRLLGPGASTRFETSAEDPPSRGELSISFVR
ncbi:MAG: MJ0042-type zinc finger domain-containing protein [Kiloniellales bacterium]